MSLRTHARSDRTLPSTAAFGGRLATVSCACETGEKWRRGARRPADGDGNRSRAGAAVEVAERFVARTVPRSSRGSAHACMLPRTRTSAGEGAAFRRYGRLRTARDSMFGGTLRSRDPGRFGICVEAVTFDYGRRAERSRTVKRSSESGRCRRSRHARRSVRCGQAPRGWSRGFLRGSPPRLPRGGRASPRVR